MRFDHIRADITNGEFLGKKIHFLICPSKAAAPCADCRSLEEKNPFFNINDVETQYRTQQILNDINEINERRSLLSQVRDSEHYEELLNNNESYKEETKITENPIYTQNQQDLDANVNTNNM